MTSSQNISPQQAALTDLCASLDSLCARIERRAGKYACNSDGYADRMVRLVAQPLRQVLGDYLSFHQSRTNSQGQVGQEHRRDFFDMIARASEEQAKLTRLCDVDMQRTGTAPGSVARLSPYFKKMMDGEHDLLCTMRNSLKDVIRLDIARLKAMPRHLRLLTPMEA